MTVTHTTRIACAMLIGLILLLVDAIPAAAHADLVSSSPPAGSTISGSPDEIVVVFDEALEDNSSIELLGANGASVATGDVDPTDRTRMVIERGDLAPGEYEVRWAAASFDGHIERGTFAFTVVDPTPRPTAASAATPQATPSPTVSPRPSASPAPGNGTPSGGTAEVLFPLLAVVIAITAIGAFLMRNRRSARR